ncbi:hypothetical protein UFOVP298_33 [uncultured Caudovirales phage]|uniref:Uncharacterized protein n=1 Tax=uncultured Caudovirales phage TaxID=2100421 RepID=A0A6J5N450_9CAUD|nr:hypothetical protein UFOVP298_33 [uncultured Caudovirales phage]CAB4150599.1 hypothetical protein UFOVP572_6 [uncultured Caudovirales phage]
MITKFIRKRNQDPAKAFNKNFARIQVSGSNQTFKFKKVAISSVGGDLLTTEAGFTLTNESGDILTTG